MAARKSRVTAAVSGIVMMEQQTTDTCSRTPFTQCLEDFRQTMVDIPVSRNRLSVLKWYGGNVAEFSKEHAFICLEALLFLFNFTGGFSSGKTHTADCCFVSGSYCYTRVSSLVTMSQTRGDLPPSSFLSMRLHQSTLPRSCSSLSLWGTQRAQRFCTPRQS